jgi:hypothetical protein
MGFFERKTRLYIRDNTCGLRLALHMVKCTKVDAVWNETDAVCQQHKNRCCEALVIFYFRGVMPKP